MLEDSSPSPTPAPPRPPQPRHLPVNLAAICGAAVEVGRREFGGDHNPTPGSRRTYGCEFDRRPMSYLADSQGNHEPSPAACPFGG